jgi:hypothetical protein
LLPKQRRCCAIENQFIALPARVVVNPERNPTTAAVVASLAE